MKMDAAKLKNCLECSVFLAVPKEKIFVCSNGHKIYESCHVKIMAISKLCPLGKCRYANPPQRNRDLEMIVDNSDVMFNCSLPE